MEGFRQTVDGIHAVHLIKAQETVEAEKATAKKSRFSRARALLKALTAHQEVRHLESQLNLPKKEPERPN